MTENEEKIEDPIMGVHTTIGDESIKAQVVTDNEEKTGGTYSTVLEGLDDVAFMKEVIPMIKSGPPLHFSASQLERSRWVEDLIRKEVVRRSNDKSPSSATYKSLLANY